MQLENKTHSLMVVLQTCKQYMTVLYKLYQCMLNKTSCLHIKLIQVTRKQLSYITCMFGYAPVNMKSWGSCCPIYCQRLPTGAGVLSLPLHCP